MTSPKYWEKSPGGVRWVPLLKPAYWLEVERLLKDDAVLLEAGCGVGRKLFALALDRRVKHAIGLDFSRFLLKITNQFQSKHKIFNVSLVVGDNRHLPFKEGTFDLILSLGVVEHFPNPQTLVTEMRDALKADGYLIIETPNKQSLATTKSWSDKAEKKLGKQELYSPQELAFLVEECNMRVLKAYSDDFGNSVAELILNQIGESLPEFLRTFVHKIVRLLFHILNPVMNHRGFLSIVVSRKQRKLANAS